MKWLTTLLLVVVANVATAGELRFSPDLQGALGKKPLQFITCETEKILQDVVTAHKEYGWEAGDSLLTQGVFDPETLCRTIIAWADNAEVLRKERLMFPDGEYDTYIILVDTHAGERYGLFVYDPDIFGVQIQTF